MREQQGIGSTGIEREVGRTQPAFAAVDARAVSGSRIDEGSIVGLVVAGDDEVGGLGCVVTPPLNQFEGVLVFADNASG